MLSKLRPYTKTIVAFIVSALQWFVLYLVLTADGKLSNSDAQALVNNVIIGLGGTAAVYQFPNKKS